MQIANPLYDHAFKYLMENNRIAKKVLSVLLDAEILELQVEQQEIISVVTNAGFKLFRLDFSALIKRKNGEEQRVTIEVQKSKLPTNILRFRSYLGNSYQKRTEKTLKNGKTLIATYPIITIYILGYNVVDIPYLAVSVDKKVRDIVANKEVYVEDDFIKQLSHEMRIIQVRRLSSTRRNRLERFLSLFNQKWVVNSKNYILDLQDIPEEFSDIAKYLQSPLGDEQFRKQLAAEEEVDILLKNQEALIANQKAELQNALRREKAAKERVKEERRQKKEAKAREEEAKAREEEERRQKENLQRQMVKMLEEQGKSLSEISQLLGLKKEDLKKLMD